MERRGTLRAILLCSALVLPLIAGSPPATASANTGAVFTLSNDPGGNRVKVFARAQDGGLTPAGSVSTGGLGSGAGLGSQGSLVLSDDGRWLLGVNAGSDDVSVFSVWGRHLHRTDVEPSRGDFPISVSVHRGLVYVLNDGSDSLTGFRLTPHGKLRAIPRSRVNLSGSDIAPAQVEFTPDGRKLVVTEKNTNLIDVYGVRWDGRLLGPNVQGSAGATPFGFAFDPRGRLIVSEAFGGAVDASAVSSYSIGRHGALSTISASVPTGETAACWVAITPDGRFAYTTNTGSNTVSGYKIGPDGGLTLLDGPAFPAGVGPIDMGIAAGSFLYTLDAGSDTISAFEIASDGSLQPGDGASGLPAASVGLAVS